MAAIFKHAYRLGKVTGVDRQRFYRTMTARGWRRNEPAAEAIADETPELARTIGQSLLTTAGLTRDEIARLTGRRNAAAEVVFLPPETRLRAL
jgi:hypothetical protein